MTDYFSPKEFISFGLIKLKGILVVTMNTETKKNNNQDVSSVIKGFLPGPMDKSLLEQPLQYGCIYILTDVKNNVSYISCTNQNVKEVIPHYIKNTLNDKSSSDEYILYVIDELVDLNIDKKFLVLLTKAYLTKLKCKEKT